MPWQKAESVPKQRLNFVSAHRAGEGSISELCRRFGLSRQAAHKWLARYEAEGPAGLEDRAHNAKHLPHKTSPEVEAALVALKREKPHWGPKKLLVLLRNQRPELAAPAVSTASDILRRHGLVVPCPQRSRRVLRRAMQLVTPTEANDCWSADHKGHFGLGDRSRCYPLTITDNFTRYILKCTALTGIDTKPARKVFQRAFEEYGLPRRIRTDNGSPFGANRGLALSSLSLWWMRLGILHERITAGVPQQNGRHERMHRTLKNETAKRPRFNQRAQQRRFDEFVNEFNHERPHEGIEGQAPAALYFTSPRQMPRHLEPLRYPASFERCLVGTNGIFGFQGATYWVSKVLALEEVGLEHLCDEQLQVWAGHLPLGILDLRGSRIVFHNEQQQREAAA